MQINDGQNLWGNEEGRGPWFETFTGKKFHPLSPSENEISEIDIAHALANQCRFTGHTRRFYSVAEHCIHVSKICAPGEEIEALMHDSSEAYLCDLSRPIKVGTDVGKPYLILEKLIMDAICKRFVLKYAMSPSIKDADNIMLGTEVRYLMHNIDGWANELPVANVQLHYWAPEQAKEKFLERFHELSGRRACQES